MAGRDIPLGSDAATGRLMRILAAFLLLAPLSTLATLLIWLWEPPWFAVAGWKQHAVMSLFAAINLAVLACCTFIAMRRRSLRGDRDAFLALLPLLAVLFHLFVLSEYAWKPGADYKAYQAYTETLLAGGDPYAEGYLYPPLQTQAMAALRTGLRWTARAAGIAVTPADERSFAYFLFAAVQFYAIAGCLLAAIALLRARTKPPLRASAGILLFFILNMPLLYIWMFRQANGLIFLLAMLAVLWTPRRPFLAGMAAAVGMSLKLYPGVLALPWLLEKRWKALAGMATGLLCLLAVQTGLFTDLSFFSSYAANLQTITGSTFYMDNSIASFARNTLALLLPADAASDAIIHSTAAAVSVAVFIGVLGAFVLLWRRQRQATPFLTGNGTGKNGNSGNGTETAAQISAAAVLAAGLLASPLTWNHHFVLALPLALLLFARGTWNARLVAGIALVFFLPTPPIFPLQYVHAAGTALLLAEAFAVRQK